MFTEELKTRIEHEVDTRSVAFGVWLYRRTGGRITRLWHRRAIVLTTTGRRSGRPVGFGQRLVTKRELRSQPALEVSI